MWQAVHGEFLRTGGCSGKKKARAQFQFGWGSAPKMGAAIITWEIPVRKEKAILIN